MDKFQLQKLRDLPIEGVAERLGLRVVRHKCLCPFHDDHHASLSFNTRRNTYRCFVCGASGGTIDLAMRILPSSAGSFKEACRWLADEHNIILEQWKPTEQTAKARPTTFDPQRYLRFFERPWLSAEAQQFLYAERRLDPRVVRWCRLSSWRDREGNNWLQTPYLDIDSRLIGVQNRNLTKGAQPRFKFPYGSQCGIYNLPVLKMLTQGEPLWITEGCSDCWAMLSAGHKAIAIPSATLLAPNDKQTLAELHDRMATPFHMFPDKDAPGERLFMQLHEVVPNLCHHELPKGCKDFSDYYLLKTADHTSN